MKDEKEQGSESWKLSRVGRVGCSRLGDVLAEGRSGAPSATRRNYMAELLCERLTGSYSVHFQSEDMLRGIELEPIARSEYEARFGIMVETDFGREHETIKGFGCSPDGLIGSDGGLEIKCPKAANHLETVLSGTVKRDYLLQMAGGVIIYGRSFWDYVSFNPDFPDNLSFYCKRFTREELPVDEVSGGVIKFLAELDALEKQVREINK
jgi:hypothetical protein